MLALGDVGGDAFCFAETHPTLSILRTYYMLGKMRFASQKHILRFQSFGLFLRYESFLHQGFGDL